MTAFRRALKIAGYGLGLLIDMRVGDDMTSTILHLPPPAPGAR